PSSLADQSLKQTAASSPGTLDPRTRSSPALHVRLRADIFSILQPGGRRAAPETSNRDLRVPASNVCLLPASRPGANEDRAGTRAVQVRSGRQSFSRSKVLGCTF